MPSRIAGRQLSGLFRLSCYSTASALQHYPRLTQVHPGHGCPSPADFPQADIVAVHGLGAEPEKTWLGNLNHSAEESQATNWLSDSTMLPSVMQNLRISTFNYESKWLGEGPVQKLPSLAEQLLSLLTRYRHSLHGRSIPLIFIGHSFGGLVIEKALIAASIPGSPFSPLASSTTGILFLGTPHRGSRMADYAVTIAKAAKTFGFSASDSLLKNLTVYSDVLQALLNNFSSIARANQYRIVCGYEQLPSSLLRGTWLKAPFQGLVVDEHSACIDGYQRFAVAANHSGLNKFAGPEDGNFHLVSNTIKDLVTHGVKTATLKPKSAIAEVPRTERVTQDIVVWLAPVSSELGLSRAIEARQPGTGGWFLKHASFQKWHSGEDHSIFWLNGKSGSGKTILLSSAVERIRELVSSTPSTAVAHFYCSYRNAKSCEPRNVFGSYIAQLCRVKPEYWSEVELLYHQTAEDVEDHEDVPISKLENLLEKIIQSFSRVYLFLNDASESRNCNKILATLETIARNCPSLKLFVASSPDNEVSEAVQKFPGKLIVTLTPDLIEVDIRKFIDARLDSLPKLRDLEGSLKCLIRDTLLSDAHGM